MGFSFFRFLHPHRTSGAIARCRWNLVTSCKYFAASTLLCCTANSNWRNSQFCSICRKSPDHLLSQRLIWLSYALLVGYEFIQRHHLPAVGFRFAPRIRDLTERIDVCMCPKDHKHYTALAGLIGGRVSHKLIRDQWEEILRLAASIKQGTVSASLMLRKLGAYPRQNGLAAALRELGRIERTLSGVAAKHRTPSAHSNRIEQGRGEERSGPCRIL